VQTRLYNLWVKIRTSFWFVPALIVIAAIAAFFLLLNIDKEYQNSAFLFLNFLDPISSSGARVILSTIAGSMITVAGTVFSITIVTLTLAATQFGPRLLRNFMRSTVNQLVLGSYIATFVYCLCVLGSVEPSGEENFVPSFSVNFAVFLALFNVGLLIYFIHHVAVSIQAETIIHNVNSDLIRSIEEFFPEESEKDSSHTMTQSDTTSSSAIMDKDLTFIKSDAFGYLQAIDKEALADIAKQHKIQMILQQKPGVFITRGMPLAGIQHNKSLDDATCNKLRNTFLLGAERTAEQDVEYAIHQLVEIAVRALSPGVNDPFTALACIDYLGSVICRIIYREFPSKHLLDDDQNILITLKTVNFDGIVNAAFDQIRQHGRDNAAVLTRLLEVFNNTLAQTNSAEQQEVLLCQAEMVHRAGLENLPEKRDRDDIEERFQGIKALLNNNSDSLSLTAAIAP